jgi:hypothetical protein
VTELDPAFLSRFCQISLRGARANFNQWKQWCRETYPDVGNLITDFCASNLDYFSPKPMNNTIKVHPCPRSWELAARLFAACDKLKASKECRIEILSGVIGKEAALNLIEFQPVLLPSVLLKEGVQACKSLLDPMTREQLCNLLWGVASYSANHLEEQTVIDVVCDFLKYLTKRNREFALAFATEMLSHRQSDENGLTVYRRATLLCNPKIANLFLTASKDKGENHEFLERLQSEQELASELARIASIQNRAS